MGRRVGGIAAIIAGGLRLNRGRPGECAARPKTMAKVRTVPQSGKQGNTVSVPGPYGQVARPRVASKNPRTLAQQRVRGALSRFATRWRKLSEDRRLAWIGAGREHQTTPRLGQSGHLTGCQLYIKINCTLALIGAPPVDDPPARPKFSRNPVGALTISNDASTIALKLEVPSSPEHHVMVMATRPCSQGISRPRRFALLGALPQATSGVADITDLFVAKYGIPPVASRVFIRTFQVADGWEDQPKDVTAVVPGA